MSNNSPKFRKPQPTTQEKNLSQGFIRKMAPKFVSIVPWVLVCVIAMFTAIIDYFISSPGVANDNKTIKNTSNTTMVFECNEWFKSNQNSVCEWTFGIENAPGKHPIMFGLISASLTSQNYPCAPPFYVISDSRRDICGLAESCTFSHKLQFGDEVKLKYNIPKQRLTIKINDTNEYLISENVYCNDKIQYKCCVILQNTNDSVTLKQFAHSYLTQPTESQIKPNKENASYYACHQFEYYCDCGCDQKYNDYKVLKKHKYAIYDTNDNWRQCDCGGFNTRNRQTALFHEFYHAHQKPFTCTIKTDGIKCSATFCQPGNICKHQNETHYQGEEIIKQNEAYDDVEPSAEEATYSNTTIYSAQCPGCNQSYSDKRSLWDCIKSHSTIKVKGSYYCNLITKEGKECDQSFGSKSNYLTHIGSAGLHRNPIQPLMCAIIEEGNMCEKTFYRASSFKNHKNREHYAGKKVIKK